MPYIDNPELDSKGKREEFIRNYISKLKFRLSDIDIEGRDLSEFYDLSDLNNLVIELLSLLKIRSQVVKENNTVDPQFDLVLKLLLENDNVVEGLVDHTKGLSKDEINTSDILRQHHELLNQQEKLKLISKILDFISSTSKKPNGIKFRQLFELTAEELVVIFENLQKSKDTSKLSGESKEILDLVYRPAVARDLQTATDESSNLLIPSLDNLENYNIVCEVAAMAKYDEIMRYVSQLREGFVWTKSRVAIRDEIVDVLTNSRNFPILLGESGVGKTTIVNAAAKLITGQEPIVLPSGRSVSSQKVFGVTAQFIKGKENTPDQSYFEYGKAIQAYTGYENSLQQNPSVDVGRILFVDEFYKSGDSMKKLYTSFKTTFELQPGDLMEGKPVLPGAGMIFATNEPGPRYPEREKADAAIERHLTPIRIDYLPLNELYEFMVACLINDQGLLKIPLEDASPNYDTVFYSFQDREIETSVLSPRLQSHGYLYRLALSFRAIQDGFNQLNSDKFIDGNFRVKTYEGNIRIIGSDGVGEPLKIQKEVMTPKFIRILLETYTAGSFSSHIKEYLLKYLNNIELSEDRKVIEALFNYFGLFENELPENKKTIASNSDIGFLFTDVPRTISFSSKQAESVLSFDTRFLEVSDKILEVLIKEVEIGGFKLKPNDFISTPSANFESVNIMQYLGVSAQNPNTFIFQYEDTSEGETKIFEYTLGDFESGDVQIILNLSEFLDVEKLRVQYDLNKKNFIRIQDSWKSRQDRGELLNIVFPEFYQVLEKIVQNPNIESIKEDIKNGYSNLVISTNWYPNYAEWNEEQSEFFMVTIPQCSIFKIQMAPTNLPDKFFIKNNQSIDEGITIIKNQFSSSELTSIGTVGTTGITFYIDNYLKSLASGSENNYYFVHTERSLDDLYCTVGGGNIINFRNVGNGTKLYILEFLDLGVINPTSKKFQKDEVFV